MTSVSSVSRLSILHVCCTDAFAGVERHIAALAADQAARGHEVHVIGGHPEMITRHIGDRQWHTSLHERSRRPSRPCGGSRDPR